MAVFSRSRNALSRSLARPSTRSIAFACSTVVSMVISGRWTTSGVLITGVHDQGVAAVLAGVEDDYRTVAAAAVSSGYGMAARKCSNPSRLRTWLRTWSHSRALRRRRSAASCCCRARLAAAALPAIDSDGSGNISGIGLSRIYADAVEALGQVGCLSARRVRSLRRLRAWVHRTDRPCSSNSTARSGLTVQDRAGRGAAASPGHSRELLFPSRAIQAVPRHLGSSPTAAAYPSAASCVRPARPPRHPRSSAAASRTQVSRSAPRWPAASDRSRRPGPRRSPARSNRACRELPGSTGAWRGRGGRAG